MNWRTHLFGLKIGSFERDKNISNMTLSMTAIPPAAQEAVSAAALFKSRTYVIAILRLSKLWAGFTLPHCKGIRQAETGEKGPLLSAIPAKIHVVGPHDLKIAASSLLLEPRIQGRKLSLHRRARRTNLAQSMCRYQLSVRAEVFGPARSASPRLGLLRPVPTRQADPVRHCSFAPEPA